MDLSGVRGVADGNRGAPSSQVEGNTGEKAGPLIHSLSFTAGSHPTSCDPVTPIPFQQSVVFIHVDKESTAWKG